MRMSELFLESISPLSESFDSPVPWRLVSDQRANDPRSGFMRLLTKLAWGDDYTQVYSFEVNGREYVMGIEHVSDATTSAGNVTAWLRDDDADASPENYGGKGATNESGASAIRVISTAIDILKKNQYVRKAGVVEFYLYEENDKQLQLFQKIAQKFGKTSSVVRGMSHVTMVEIYI